MTAMPACLADPLLLRLADWPLIGLSLATLGLALLSAVLIAGLGLYFLSFAKR
jgi:hypothetical protein